MAGFRPASNPPALNAAQESNRRPSPWRLALNITLFGTLAVAVLGSTLAIARQTDDYQFFDPLIDVKHLLTERYVRDVDEQELQTAAIRGMLEVLDDPYTVYVPPVDTEQFQKSLTGEYVGIGALIGLRDDWLTVITPLDGSPALRAGVRADDRIVEIQGESTEGLTTEQAVDRLTGEENTIVNVIVERAGERLPIEITRKKIRTVPVKGAERVGDDSHWDFMLDEQSGIGYIWVTQFTPNVDEYFTRALDELGADEGDLNGLIIDLRWNPGGVLEQAVRMADHFVDDGTIVSIRSRDGREAVFTASAPDTLSEFPIAVLLNEQSASASEILAGALQDLGRAIVVGARSVGKGSVQSVIQLPNGNGGQLKLTEQLYYLPSGRSLQREDDSTQWGVDPTPGFYIPIDDDKASEILLARQQADVIDAEAESPEAVDDPQLQVALNAIRGYIRDGEWTPFTDASESMRTLAVDELRRAERTRERLLRELTRIDRRIDSLESAAPEDAEAAEFDLWEDERRVAGGELTITDADGQHVATLRITEPTIERWLIDAGVEKIEADTAQPPQSEQDK